MRLDPFQPTLRCLVLLAGLSVAVPLLALPEDSQQAVNVDASSGGFSLADGWVIYKGTNEKPAKVSQGSLIVTGLEIRIYHEHGELQTVIVTGNPARFQQIINPNEEPVHASGKQIKLDSKTRLLTIDSDDATAEFNQKGTTARGTHFDYNLDTHRANATAAPGGEQIHMTFPPKKKDGQ